MYIADFELNLQSGTCGPRKKEDPFSFLAREAFEKIRQRGTVEQEAEMAILFANCFGGWTFGEPQLQKLAEHGPGGISAFQAIAWFPAAAQGQVTIENNLRTAALTFSSEGVAFLHALQLAEIWLERGKYLTVFAGASESCGSPFLRDALGLIDPRDAALWMRLSKSGRYKVTIEQMSEFNLEDGTAVHVNLPEFQGTPVRGACALPMIMLAALSNQPSAYVLDMRFAVVAAKDVITIYA
ncbi:hypothetical protein [Caballeronia sp. LZ035]|uniref:hypothetical protein n=1 Tax=Caballeronia sp. LZ035 TaxID=3038568 RepID=UPI002864DA93|nr:hypothetical protein [Caballeronia sp. LZ035]MDR5759695.1 hypothetical protein [Caballeronia sp. LZ035]